MHFYGRIFHEGNRHFEGIHLRAPDAGELDNILAAEAVAPIADVMASFAPRGGGKELTTIHAADLLGLVKVFQVASADHAAGLVGHGKHVLIGMIKICVQSIFAG